jgi:hypothetical protein
LALCAIGLPFVGCNHSNCEVLRDDLYAQKLKWQQCDSDLDCMEIGGNSKDCTGILSCNLSINRRYRDEAVRRIASLPEDSVDCMLCVSPNCEEGMISICEPVTKQCLLVTKILDGGAASASFFTPDSGAPPPDFGAGGSP